MLGLSAQPFGSPAPAAPAEQLVLYPLLGPACGVSHFLSFLLSVARVPRTRAARRRLSTRLPAVVYAASPGAVGVHRIRPRPPLYAVLLAGAAVTVTSSSFPHPGSIDGAFDQQGNPNPTPPSSHLATSEPQLFVL